MATPVDAVTAGLANLNRTAATVANVTRIGNTPTVRPAPVPAQVPSAEVDNISSGAPDDTDAVATPQENETGNGAQYDVGHVDEEVDNERHERETQYDSDGNPVVEGQEPDAEDVVTRLRTQRAELRMPETELYELMQLPADRDIRTDDLCREFTYNKTGPAMSLEEAGRRAYEFDHLYLAADCGKTRRSLRQLTERFDILEGRIRTLTETAGNSTSGALNRRPVQTLDSFSGAEDGWSFEDWQDKVAKVMRLSGIEPNDWVKWADLNLVGDAAATWQEVKPKADPSEASTSAAPTLAEPTWEEFVGLMRPRFQDKAAEELATAKFDSARMASPINVRNLTAFGKLIIDTYEQMGAARQVNELGAFNHFMSRMPSDLAKFFEVTCAMDSANYDVNLPNIDLRTAINNAVQAATKWINRPQRPVPMIATPVPTPRNLDALIDGAQRGRGNHSGQKRRADDRGSTQAFPPNHPVDGSGRHLVGYDKPGVVPNTVFDLETKQRCMNSEPALCVHCHKPKHSRSPCVPLPDSCATRRHLWRGPHRKDREATRCEAPRYNLPSPPKVQQISMSQPAPRLQCLHAHALCADAIMAENAPEMHNVHSSEILHADAVMKGAERRPGGAQHAAGDGINGAIMPSASTALVPHADDMANGKFQCNGDNPASIGLGSASESHVLNSNAEQTERQAHMPVVDDVASMITSFTPKLWLPAPDGTVMARNDLNYKTICASFDDAMLGHNSAEKDATFSVTRGVNNDAAGKDSQKPKTINAQPAEKAKGTHVVGATLAQHLAADAASLTKQFTGRPTVIEKAQSILRRLLLIAENPFELPDHRGHHLWIKPPASEAKTALQHYLKCKTCSAHNMSHYMRCKRHSALSWLRC